MLMDISVCVLQKSLTQSEANQLVKNITSDHAWSEVEYDLGLHFEEDQSFQGLINLLP